MLVLLSPAKTFNTKDAVPTDYKIPLRQPKFLAQANSLVSQLKDLESTDIAKLLSVSEKIAQTNFERYQDWNEKSIKTNRPAAFAFWGDVNRNFNAFTLTEEQIKYADDHVLFLSGLYGALRPLDYIQEYRLEMGTSFPATEDCKNLYAFWKDTLVKYLNERIKKEKVELICNLASKEYFSAVDFKRLDCPAVEIVFKDQKNGKHKVISVIAKRSRGLMARWIVENEIKTAEQLKGFNVDGYYFKEDESSDTLFTFYRDEK